MTPDEYTNREFFLEVGNGHELYVHDWGNKNAKTPIIFLHGGPGSGCNDKYKSGFDPKKQRVIFHDQRGCGKSLPYGSLDHNTTTDLTEDITKIADKLELKQLILTGGSWGSCLALAYALQYPKRVKAMVLRGIFTGSQTEIDWLDQGKFQTFYPEVWERYLAATPEIHHTNPSTFHFEKALGNNEQIAKKSAYAYENLESSILKLDDRFLADSFDDYDPAGIRIEISYLKNHCFMPDRHILDNAHRLTMPVHLVQGRYDMVCPPATAYELSKKLANDHLIWTLGGHQNEHEGWNIMRTILLQLSESSIAL